MKRHLVILLVVGLLAATGCGRNEPAKPLDPDPEGPGVVKNGHQQPVEVPRDPSGLELEKLRGTWVIVLVEEQGQFAEEGRGRQYTFQADQFNVRDPDGDVVASGTCKPNAAGKVKEMDLVYRAGTQAGQTVRSIYELQGDTLKLCAAPADADRPVQLATSPGSSASLLTLKRDRTREPAADPAWLEAGRLQGTWVVVAGEGGAFSQAKGKQFIFFGDQFNIKDPSGKVLSFGTWKLDGSGKIKAIDLNPRAGSPERKAMQLLGELDGDRLKICTGLPGAKRPASFSVVPGAGVSLLVLRREEALRDEAELDRLRGTWEVISAEQKGAALDEARGRQFIFLDDQFNVRDAKGKVLSQGTCKLVAGGEIRKMDLLYRGGAYEGATARLIYALEPDTLKICLAPPNTERPEAFATRPDSEALLLVLKRPGR